MQWVVRLFRLPRSRATFEMRRACRSGCVMVSGPCIAAEATSTEATGARRSSYDVVVIGAGIAGLVAGALLARVGKAVLVVESDPQPGGYAQSLRRGEHVFDRADHLTWGAEPEGPLTPGFWDALLRYLDVRSECEFLRVDDPVYAASFPGLDLAVPSGREPFLDAHLRRFPNDAAALRRLTELSVDIYLEMQQMPLNPRPLDLVSMPRRFPLTWQYRSATLQDVLDAELTDARLKSACCALWYWIGTPPSRQPFLYWASMMTAFIEDGACYPRGGYQQLVDALVTRPGEGRRGTAHWQRGVHDRRGSRPGRRRRTQQRAEGHHPRRGLHRGSARHLRASRPAWQPARALPPPLAPVHHVGIRVRDVRRHRPRRGRARSTSRHQPLPRVGSRHDLAGRARWEGWLPVRAHPHPDRPDTRPRRGSTSSS